MITIKSSLLLKFCSLLAMLFLPIGCASNSNSSKAEGIVNSLVSERLKDSCLVKITEARYEKSKYNTNLKMNNVLYVVEGIVECAISESVAEKLPVGTTVRSVELVDDVSWTRKILAQMNGSDSIRIEPRYSYAFFYEYPPPDSPVRAPISGWFDAPGFWIATEFYDPDVTIDDDAFINAFRIRAVSPKFHVGLENFKRCVLQVPSEQTNIVYYAGTCNGHVVLAHLTLSSNHKWDIGEANIEQAIMMPYTEDKAKWILLKDSDEECLRHWDWHKEIEDFVQKQSEKSALVKHCSAVYKVDGDLADDTACVWIVDVFSVEATLCDALKNGDKICTEQLYDGSKGEKQRIISEARRNGNPIVERRLQDRGLCFAHWDEGKFISLKELASERLFIIDNEIIAPFEVVWNLTYDGLIHFDENVAIQAYKRRVKQMRHGQTRGGM
jgi:hypothetical protein